MEVLLFSGAFKSLNNLNNLILPNTITTIGGYSFAEISGNFTNLDLSNCTNLISIGRGAFETNPLQTVSLNDCSSLLTLDNFAFYNCSSLTSITLPSSLQTIGTAAGFGDGSTFFNCSNLLAVDCEGFTNLTTIYPNTFNSCPSIASIDFSGCTSLSSIDLTGLTGLTTLKTAAFANCNSLTSFDFSQLTALTDISNNTFENCGLVNITIPNTVIGTLGELTFQDCTNLISITFTGARPSDLNNNGNNLGNTPFLGLTSSAVIYVYYAFSSTNPTVGLSGFATSYLRGSIIPVHVLDSPAVESGESKSCCPPPIYYNKLRQMAIMGSGNSQKMRMAQQIKQGKGKVIFISQNVKSLNSNPNIVSSSKTYGNQET